jgi:hypothetical protein
MHQMSVAALVNNFVFEGGRNNTYKAVRPALTH